MVTFYIETLVKKFEVNNNKYSYKLYQLLDI